MQKIVQRLFTIISVSLLTSIPLFSATIKLQWDSKTASDSRTFVRAYERFGSAAPYTYTLVGQTAEPSTTVTITGVLSGTHTYIVRGANSQGESADSNAVSAFILAVPGVVTSVTITIEP